MSAPLVRGTAHLLVADWAVGQGYGTSGYVTVCGELVSSSDLLPARCPAECDDDPRYCPQCVHAALRWSAKLGDDASGCDSPDMGTYRGNSVPDSPDMSPCRAPEPRQRSYNA